MTAQNIHLARIKEHFQVLKDAVAIGIENRPATLGLHISACVIDLLELYLHKKNRIPIGKQIKHEWFKRPKLGQKVKPLAERNLEIEFEHKEEIFELLYSIEEKRNKLIYGHASLSEIKQIITAFDRFKVLLLKLLDEEGEKIEDTDS